MLSLHVAWRGPLGWEHSEEEGPTTSNHHNHLCSVSGPGLRTVHVVGLIESHSVLLPQEPPSLVPSTTPESAGGLHTNEGNTVECAEHHMYLFISSLQ